MSSETTPPSRDQITEAVLAFVNAKSLAEKKQIVEAHSSALLTDDADEFMAYLLAQQYSDDEDATHILEEHRTLLLRCRREGIEAAFADIVAPGDPSTTVPELIVEAVMAFVNAQTWAESKQIVEASPDVLLTDDADEVLANLLAQYKEDEDATRTLEEHRALLLRCRREGIEATFASLAAHANSLAAAQESFGESLIEVLRALISAQTWTECKQIVENYPNLLLTEAADQVLVKLLAQNKDNEAATSILEEHRGVLNRCRREGIEAAFADHVARTNPPDSAPQSLVEVVMALVNAQTWTESKQLMEAHRDVLLANAAVEVLVTLLEHYKDNEDATRRLEEYRALLARCRDEGIDAAFADRRHQPTAQRESELGALLEELGQLTKPSDMPRAVAVCQAALELVSRDSQPELWARLQGRLGNSLAQNPLGDRAQNIEEAIEHFELALEVYTRHDLPERWAETQNNLANAYAERMRGERAQNIEDAIKHYELALEVRTRQDFPQDWAMTQNNLAMAYRDRILGERAQNIEDAIEHYELALEIRTRQDFTQDWAETQNNLANAYLDRIRGERAHNIEEAIKQCELALEVRTRQDFPEQWAMTQNNLANAYWKRIRGDRAQNIEEANKHYELALEVFTRQDFPERWAAIQDNLANAYRDRIIDLCIEI